MHLTPHYLYRKVSRSFIYKLEGHFGCDIYLCFVYLSRYKIIILEGHLVIKSELLVTPNETSSFVKLPALSLVLIRVYLLHNKGLSSCLLVIVRTY